jgi:hypothetical protein
MPRDESYARSSGCARMVVCSALLLLTQFLVCCIHRLNPSCIAVSHVFNVESIEGHSGYPRHDPPCALVCCSFPSDPPSEEGSPGKVRSRCPTTAVFWPASLATGPAGLPQRGQSDAVRPGRRARFFGYFLAAQQESISPAGASPGISRRRKTEKSALVIRRYRG